MYYLQEYLEHARNSQIVHESKLEMEIVKELMARVKLDDYTTPQQAEAYLLFATVCEEVELRGDVANAMYSECIHVAKAVFLPS